MNFRRAAAITVAMIIGLTGYTSFAESNHTHDFKSVTENPTCDKDGLIKYTCTDCSFEYEEVLPATGHKFEADNFESTYVEKGVTGKIACKHCGLVQKSGHFTEKKILDVPKFKKIKTVDIDTLKLTWEAVKDADGYYIYRKIGKKIIKIATVKTNSYEDDGLTIGDKYKYKIKAFINEDGKTATSKTTPSKGSKIPVKACKKYEIDINNYEFPLPGISRVSVTSPYGYRGSGFHAGIDLDTGTGDKVVAWKDGYVVKAMYHSSWGKFVMIYHGKWNGKDVYTGYAHLDKISVKKGEQVLAGEKIGTSGNTGRSFGDHLHFEVYYGGKSYKKPPEVKTSCRINPAKYIGLKNKKGWQNVK